MGIDVGGTYADKLATSEGQDLAYWCRFVVQASVITIGAPCRWRSDGRA